MEIKRNLSKRNLLNTNYKINAIVFYIPFIGWYINEYLFKKGKAIYTYKKGYNDIALKIR